MDKKFVIIGGAVLAVLVIFLVWPKEKAAKPSSPPAAASSKEARELYHQAVKLVRMNEPVRARAMFQEIIKSYPEQENIAAIQKDLETLNMGLIFSNREVPGKTVVHEVAAGDSLVKIAKQYSTTVDLIRKSNNLKGDVIRLGQKLRVWSSKFNIFVDKSQNILILKDGNEVVKVYNVSTGENNSTPVGTYKIISKLENPVWFNKGVVVPPESPQNVLGTRWLGFDLPGYGIHGTVEPQNIGQQVTAGCVRMRNEEVEELYSIVPQGTEVTIVD